jgi:hypothetical protein
MLIYIFESQPKPELRAFAEDETGTALPEQFAPWSNTGMITEDKKPPFRLPRAEIEKAIKAQGFQLWRVKQPPADGPASGAKSLPPKVRTAQSA